MEEKQINKWLRRRFSVVGWTLTVYYLILNLLVTLAVALDAVSQMLWNRALGDFRSGVDLDAIMGNAWGYLLTIAVGLVILNAWKGPDYWKSEILVKEKSMTAGTFFCILSLCIGAQMVNSLWITLLEGILNRFDKSAMDILDSVSGGSNTFSMFLYASFLAPVSEEILFRGFVLRSLRPYGKRFAIFGSALLFGLFHGNLLQTPYAFLAGLLLGYMMVEYSIVWAAALHIFNNLVLADLLTRLTEALPEILQAMVNLLIFGGFAAVSVTILIVKRREIREYNRSEWMDRRCLKCFFTNSGILVLMAMMVLSMLWMLLL